MTCNPDLCITRPHSWHQGALKQTESTSCIRRCGLGGTMFVKGEDDLPFEVRSPCLPGYFGHCLENGRRQTQAARYLEVA